MLPQQTAPINIIPPNVTAQVERKRSLHDEMGSKGLLVKQGSRDYAAGPLPAQRLQGQLPPQGYAAGPLPPQTFTVAGGQLPQGIPNVGVTPVPSDPFIQKAQGIRPGEGLLYDARGLPLDAQGYLPNTGPTIGQRMRDAAHIGEPNGQPSYVDVHSSFSTGRSFEQAPLPQAGPILERERVIVRDQAMPLPPQQLPPQQLPPQQLPPQQFVQQQGQFVQQQGQFVQQQGQFVQQQGQFVQQQQFVAAPPVVPVKGVGIIDKLYMGAHNLKEHLKDKMYAHQETREMKKIAEAQMEAERKAFEAQQLPLQAQLEGERKAILLQQETAIGGLERQLTAERAALEQRQAEIQAQLDAERRAFLAAQEHKFGGLKSKFDAQKAVIEGEQITIERQLEAERLALKQQQDAAAAGLKDQLKEQRKIIEAEGVQRRAVENQMFVNQVMAEHTEDALQKEARLGLKAERYAIEENLAQQAALEKAAFKEAALQEKELIQQQAQQAAFVQSQLVQPAQTIIQPAQQFITPGPTILEKETRILTEQALPVQNFGQQGVAGVQNWANTAVGNVNANVGQATNSVNMLERRAENAVVGGFAGAGGAMYQQGAGLMNQGQGFVNQGQGLLNQGGTYVDQFGNTVQREVDNDVNKIRGGQEFIQKERDTVRDPSGRLVAEARNIEKDAIKQHHGKTEIKHEEKTKVNERI